MGLSAILEFLVCARLRAALDAAQHEALLGSVQRILRGVCDGAVLLDDEHRVQGTAETWILVEMEDREGQLEGWKGSVEGGRGGGPKDVLELQCRRLRGSTFWGGPFSISGGQAAFGWSCSDSECFRLRGPKAAGAPRPSGP